MDGTVLGAEETYRFWAAQEVPKGTRVFNGQYWSSVHFTKEYILYMELEASWVLGFVKTNGLKRAKSNPVLPSGAPKWFRPGNRLEVWEGTQGSVYYVDPITGHMFMYEVQL